jgi:hypothetical protein
MDTKHHLRINEPEDVQAAIAAALPLAAALATEVLITLTLTGDEFVELFDGDRQTAEIAPEEDENEHIQALVSAGVAVAKADAAEASAADAPPRIRRSKDEIAAGLSVEQAVVFRASGTKDPAAWLAAQAKGGGSDSVSDASTDDDLGDLANPTDDAEPADDGLDDLLEGSAEPEPVKVVTYEEMAQIVKKTNQVKGRDVLVALLAKLKKPSFKEVEPKDFAFVVKELKRELGE